MARLPLYTLSIRRSPSGITLKSGLINYSLYVVLAMQYDLLS